MHARTEIGRFHWGYLIAVVGLVLALLLPAAIMAQGIKDRPSSDDPATEEATEEPTDDPAEEATEEPTDEADWEAAGLIDDESYESPQFEYTIEWSRDWAVDEYYDPPVVTDEENEQDILYLIWGEDGGEVAYAIFSGQTLTRGGPDADVEEWLDPDFIERQWNPNFDVDPLLDDTAGAVLYSVVDTDDNDAQYYTVYQSIEMEDGTTLYLTFSAHEDWLEDSYTSWSEDVEINGEPVAVIFDWADIEEAIDDA